MAQTQSAFTYNTFPKYGAVYLVDLDPIVGSEIGKRRPAIVVSNDINNEHAAHVTVVPLTGQPVNRVYPFEAVIPHGIAGLSTESRAKCNQVRTVDKQRLVQYFGDLPSQYIEAVKRALMVHMNLS